MTEQNYPPPGNQYGPGPGQAPAGPTQYGAPYAQPNYASDQRPQGGYYAPAPVTRPPAMDKAVLMMKVGAILSALSALLVFPMKGMLREAVEKSVRDSGQTASGSEIDTITNFAIGSTIVMSLVGAGLWWLMAVMNGKGKSWARILSTIFFGLSLLQFVYGLSQPSAGPMTMIASIVLLLVGAAAVWFMWQKESSAYYEAAGRK